MSDDGEREEAGEEEGKREGEGEEESGDAHLTSSLPYSRRVARAVSMDSRDFGSMKHSFTVTSFFKYDFKSQRNPGFRAYAGRLKCAASL